MHAENRMTIRGDIDQIFAMASAVEKWPRVLPHYRWVNVLSGDSTERVVELAAHRNGFPARRTACQRLKPTQHCLHFTHVRWEQAWHGGHMVFGSRESRSLCPHCSRSLLGLVTHSIIGELFVGSIASQTLRTITRYIEGRMRQPQGGAWAAQGQEHRPPGMVQAVSLTYGPMCSHGPEAC